MDKREWASALRIVTDYAKRRQTKGDLLGWFVRDASNRVEFLVPDDIPEPSFPSEVAGIPIDVYVVPRARDAW
jgi:hypothetical protein